MSLFENLFDLIVQQVGIVTVVVVGILLVIGVGPLVIMCLPKKTDLRLEKRLKEIDKQLSCDPENGELLIVRAELLLRKGTPYSSFGDLERAFKLGQSEEKLAPTFWAGYRVVSAGSFDPDMPRNTTFWTRINDEAPQLVSRLAVDINTADKILEQRKKSDDTNKRDQLVLRVGD
jgi:hypothetical protein